MWSNVYEKITDGTSGLNPGTTAGVLVVGTSSNGAMNTPVAIGKKTNIQEVFGFGSLSGTLEDMQLSMGDVSVLAMRVAHDIEGSAEIVTHKGLTPTIVGSALSGVKAEISVKKSGDFTCDPVQMEIAFSGDRMDTLVVDLPQDGVLDLKGTGLSLVFPMDSGSILNLDDKWTLESVAGEASFAEYESVISAVLERENPEIVVIAQNCNADFVGRLGSFAEQLFSDHKATLFLTETRLDKDVDLNVAINNKKSEFAEINARFVSVVCQEGFVKTALGDRFASALGLCIGYLTKSNVNQSIGATHYFPVADFELPEGWENEHSRTLDESRFVTLRNYAGLRSLYWSNGRTMADDTSDYRFIEVVRTVFKAIRLARMASLPFVHAPGDDIGIQNLLADVRRSLGSMTKSLPKELDSFLVNFPSGQDIVNNGVVLTLELFGIPIIRSITLDFQFKYLSNEN